MKIQRDITAWFLLIGSVFSTLLVGIAFNSYQDYNDILARQAPQERALNAITSTKEIHIIDTAIKSYNLTGNRRVLLSVYPEAFSLQNATIIWQTLSQNNFEQELTNALHDYASAFLVFAREPSPYGSEAANAFVEKSNLFILYYHKQLATLIKTDTEHAKNLQILLKKSTLEVLLLSFTAVLLSVITAGYFILSSVKSQKLAQKNALLAKREHRANYSKSRLLTMLSHEIRTPLNGVLGYSTIASFEDDPENIKPILKKMHESAASLVGFLDSVASYPLLDNLDIARSCDYYFLSQIDHMLQTRLQTEEEMHCDIMHENNVSPLIYIDAEHLVLTLIYVARQIKRCLSQKTISLKTTFHGDEWIWSIDLQAKDPYISTQLLRLDDSFGERQDQIETETLETAFAHGIIQAMDGRISVKLSKQHPENHRILLFFPIDPSLPASLKIGVLDKTDALKHRLQQSFGKISPVFLSTEDFHRADYIFIPDDGDLPHEQIRRAQSIAPQAKLVAVRMNTDSHRCDYTHISYPKEIVDLNSKITT